MTAFLPLFFVGLIPLIVFQGPSEEVLPENDGPLPLIYEETPPPDPHATPPQVITPGPTDAPSITTQVFEIVFSSESFIEAIETALQELSKKEFAAITNETGQITSALGSLAYPPMEGHFAAVAGSSTRAAAALAPVLFLLRLALHHWRRLLGEQEGLVVVIGDWVTAGFLAAAVGPFLDMLVQTGWWLSRIILGEMSLLVQEFLSASLVSNMLGVMPVAGRSSMFFSVFAIGAGLGGLVGVLGIAFAFAVAQAVLFVLAVIGPVVAVISVVPQMRWMRGVWIKSVGVLALLPVAAGAVFKAAVVLVVSFGGSGFAELLIRLCWLWGAAGFLLSMAGILGKVTLSTALDTAGKVTSGVRSVVSVAMMASGSPGGASLATPAVRGSSTLAAFGREGVAGQRPMAFPEIGADRGFGLAQHFSSAGLDQNWVREKFPEEAVRMAEAYSLHADIVDAAPEPLLTAARLGSAVEFMNWLNTGEDS